MQSVDRDYRGSPFSQTRWEYEQRHVYYLPPHLLRRVESHSPTYLIGSRGSGKTTLLRALWWRERLNNELLRAQLECEPFGGRYVGLYFKLPEVQLQLLERWLSAFTDDIAGPIFATYLDCVWLQLACEAVEALGEQGIVPFEPADAKRAVAAIRTAAAPWPDGPPSSPAADLPALQAALRQTQRAIESAARHDADPATTADALPVVGFGDLGRSIGTELGQLLGQNKPGPPWRFYVCMDEGEALSARQQLALNTVVRLTQAPVFFVVSFVGRPADVTRTLVPALTLGPPDRTLLALDDPTDAEFRDFAEGVATLRLRAFAGTDEPFNVRASLGPLNLNALVGDLVAGASGRAAESLATDAAALAARGWGTDGDALPYIEAYALQRAGKAPQDTPSDPAERRRLSSSIVRKANVTSYLAICHQLRARPRYASGDMLLSLSDNCIRDFLWQMDELFLAAGTVERLLAGNLSIEQQDDALVRASEAKLDRILNDLVISPEHGKQFVVGLAKVTREMLAVAVRGGRLDAEPGLFKLRIDDSRSAEQAALLVRDAAEAGYLRLDSEGTDWTFRVHTSLAAAFKLSYRGAYRASRIAPEEVMRLAGCPPHELDKIVNRIARDRANCTEAEQSMLDLRDPGVHAGVGDGAG